MDLHESEQSRANMMKAREDWFEDQLDLDLKRIALLGKIAAATNITRRHGRARSGERCRMPLRHYKNTTVTADLRGSGPFVIDLVNGATTRISFLSCFTDVLVTALRSGDTVKTKNLSAHKVKGGGAP